MEGGKDIRAVRPGASARPDLVVPWRPIASGELALRASSALADIAAVIDAVPPEPLPAGAPEWFRLASAVDLAGGSAGVALLHAQLALATGDERERELAEQGVAALAEALADVPMGLSLMGGFSGLAWTIDRIERSLRNDEDLAAEIDGALVAHLARSPWLGDYDLVSGLAGFGAYALSRLPARTARPILRAVLDRLEELALPDLGGLAWRTPPELLPPQQRETFPAGCWNFGLAHGVPGVVAVLAGMASARFEVARVRSLLRPAVDWLLARRLSGQRAYPALVSSGEPREPARLAWCYGDPGVCLALVAAGAALKDPALIDVAVEIAASAAATEPARSGVVDTGLCHGAAGLLHIFNRLYQATGDERLAAGARRWLEVTLEMRRPGEAVAGFPAWRTSPEPHWVAAPGLVDGAAGVGLALAAAIHPIEPIWDGCMLMKLPPMMGWRLSQPE